MREVINSIESAEQLAAAAKRLREIARQGRITPQSVLEVLEAWSTALDSPEVRGIPGVTFLRLWLRRRTLEQIVLRELGPEAVCGGWQDDGRARLRVFPIGVVGHWPAGNIEIQPILSLTCALLGGNSSIVRVPTSLFSAVRLVMERLEEVDRGEILMDRIFMASFDHSRADLYEAMARAVDGAMIWGAAESVSYVRSLPFPPWARIAVFGPRVSVAAMDKSAWSNRAERLAWCRRMARDVWQFEQRACTSPQVLFLERDRAGEPEEFVKDLAQAFGEENRLHPRREIEPALCSAICQARASWLLNDPTNSATFPQTPDWTILLGRGIELPRPTQGKTLTVLVVDDLFDAVSGFDGGVQTLGLAMTDPLREETLAQAAARHGVDRIVKLGQMHLFSSPWDGRDLVRPMLRVIRHVPSSPSATEQPNGRCATVFGSVGSEG